MVISHFEIATFSISHYGRCTFASFPMLHNMRNEEDGCCSLFIRKGSTGLVAFKRSVPLGLSGKSPHLRVVFSAKTLCKPAPLPLFCYKKESAYSDLWTHKKNVAMDKQKVNTTSSMNRKGYSSSSHYRINPVAEKVSKCWQLSLYNGTYSLWRAFVIAKYISCV